MARRAPDELRELWLSAVRLPGYDDAKDSCLAELAEYTGLTKPEVEARCERAVEDQRDSWAEKNRDSDEELIDFYDQCDAYVYELLWWHALEQGEAPAWNARLATLARERGLKNYLDFGGGVGTNAILLANEGCQVTHADVSDVLLEFARWRFKKRGLDVWTIDLKSERVEPNTYDLISAIDVLEHVSKPLATLEELSRALVSGGVFLFDLIASKPDPERPFHLMRSKYPVRSRLRSFGLKQIEAFEKYLVLEKVDRPALSNQLLGTWDRLRWRSYYALQLQWPSVSE